MTMELRSDRLRVFSAVARELGFSRAARALGMTQSSVSQAIAVLEADVGEALFVREGRQVGLTEAGQVLLERSGVVLAELERSREALLGLREVTSGTLSLGTSDTLATWVLPPVFAAFRAQFPGVDLKLDNRPSPAIAQKVAARELDLGVVSLPLPAPAPADVSSLTQAPLVALRDVVITPVQRQWKELAGRRRVRAAELASVPLLLLDRSTASRSWLDAQFAAARVAPRVTMEMGSIEVLKRLVELGFGASVVPEVAVAEEVRARRLVAIELNAPRRMVGLVVPRSPSRATRAFVAVAKQVLRNPQRKKSP